MIELPESYTLARQIGKTLAGRTVASADADASPHKFAWYFGDPNAYNEKLAGRRVTDACAYGGMVEVRLEDMRLLFGDGVVLRLLQPGEKVPQKHQLLVRFDDGCHLLGTVQMYGGLWAFREGENDNPYYLVAKKKPAPYESSFNEEYFRGLLGEGTCKLSAKAFLATEQRIPGLGNGVLQDILYNARIHPKRKMSTLTNEDITSLYRVLKRTLDEMAAGGGRDTERDFFGKPGGYRTKMSKNSAGMPCPVCGGLIKKEAYMGGSVYFCEGCQKL